MSNSSHNQNAQKIEFPPIYWRVHENFLNYLYANHKKNIMNFDVNKSVPD